MEGICFAIVYGPINCTTTQAHANGRFVLKKWRSYTQDNLSKHRQGGIKLNAFFGNSM
jgi:hypothetical protein